MTSAGSLSKVLTFRVKQLNNCHQKLQASLSGYVGQITGCAQAWIENSEDRDQDRFVDITVQLDEAMMMLVEMTSNVENNLAGLLSGAAPAGAAVQSTEDSPAQINAAPPGLDASIRSLLERLDALKNVTDMVQELRTDLDSCKTQMDTVEGMRESLENITSYCGTLIHASSAQVKTRCEQFHTSQLTQMQHFDKQLSQMQTLLSKTDSEMKDVAKFVNVFREQFADRIRTLTEHEDQLPAVENMAQIEPQHKDNSLSDLHGRLCHLETVTDTTDDVVRGIREELAILKTKNGPMEEQMWGESGSTDASVFLEKFCSVGLEACTLDKNGGCRFDKPLPPVEEAMTRREETTYREKAWTCREVESLQIASVAFTVSSQPPAVKVTEPPVTRWTGFCVQCLDDIKTGQWSTSIHWKVLSRGTSCGFDVRDSVFIAPVSGLYLVLFVHYQTGTKPTTVRVILSGKRSWQERVMITTDTTNCNEYAVGQRYISMKAGDSFYLLKPSNQCRFQIPFFSCVLVS